EGPKEWVGTEITFRLVHKDGQTFVLFTHANWKEVIEFMHHCSTKWATFLLSLKNLLERDEGRPLPFDVKIHVGD
ncbi:MAG TPA: SRPBCC domain-containing protein, partial [Alphaproteobacteria bacterium]|nr:SRPBCC domain-containing protein [Alphaproteobacteria bacterium]